MLPLQLLQANEGFLGLAAQGDEVPEIGGNPPLPDLGVSALGPVVIPVGFDALRLAFFGFDLLCHCPLLGFTLWESSLIPIWRFAIRTFAWVRV